jgi:hypothetical protein
MIHAPDGDAAATARLALPSDADQHDAGAASEEVKPSHDVTDVPQAAMKTGKTRNANVTALPKRATAHAAGGAALRLEPFPPAVVDHEAISDVAPVERRDLPGPVANSQIAHRALWVPPVLLEQEPTSLAEGVDQTRIVQRGPRPRFRLAFSNGEEHQVLGPSLLGRRPSTQPGEDTPRLITIHDPERSVSKTHLELGIESGRLWIADRWSSNGTVLTTPNGFGRVCDPGRRYEVEAGSSVEIGDVTFTVTSL